MLIDMFIAILHYGQTTANKKRSLIKNITVKNSRDERCLRVIISNHQKKEKGENRVS